METGNETSWHVNGQHLIHFISMTKVIALSSNNWRNDNDHYFKKGGTNVRAYTIVACLRFSTWSSLPSVRKYCFLLARTYSRIFKYQVSDHNIVLHMSMLCIDASCIWHHMIYWESLLDLSSHFYAAMRKNAHANFNWSLVRPNTDQWTEDKLIYCSII